MEIGRSISSAVQTPMLPIFIYVSFQSWWVSCNITYFDIAYDSPNLHARDFGSLPPAQCTVAFCHYAAELGRTLISFPPPSSGDDIDDRCYHIFLLNGMDAKESNGYIYPSLYAVVRRYCSGDVHLCRWCSTVRVCAFAVIYRYMTCHIIYIDDLISNAGWIFWIRLTYNWLEWFSYVFADDPSSWYSRFRRWLFWFSYRPIVLYVAFSVFHGCTYLIDATGSCIIHESLWARLSSWEVLGC